jgi:hypothetical protein
MQVNWGKCCEHPSHYLSDSVSLNAYLPIYLLINAGYLYLSMILISYYQYICICINFTALLSVLSETSRRRQKTIELRGTCANIVEFCCCWSSSILFSIFLSLHVTLFSFSYLFSLFLLFLSWYLHMMKIVAVAATVPRRLGLKMPENISSSNRFSFWSLLPLVNPLVEF